MTQSINGDVHTGDVEYAELDNEEGQARLLPEAAEKAAEGTIFGSTLNLCVVSSVETPLFPANVCCSRAYSARPTVLNSLLCPQHVNAGSTRS